MLKTFFKFAGRRSTQIVRLACGNGVHQKDVGHPSCPCLYFGSLDLQAVAICQAWWRTRTTQSPTDHSSLCELIIGLSLSNRLCQPGRVSQQTLSKAVNIPRIQLTHDLAGTPISGQISWSQGITVGFSQGILWQVYVGKNWFWLLFSEKAWWATKYDHPGIDQLLDWDSRLDSFSSGVWVSSKAVGTWITGGRNRIAGIGRQGRPWS